jgi:hypothetical protein
MYTKWTIRRSDMSANRTLSNPQETFLRTHVYAYLTQAPETSTYSSFAHK